MLVVFVLMLGFDKNSQIRNMKYFYFIFLFFPPVFSPVLFSCSFQLQRSNSIHDLTNERTNLWKDSHYGRTNCHDCQRHQLWYQHQQQHRSCVSHSHRNADERIYRTIIQFPHTQSHGANVSHSRGIWSSREYSGASSWTAELSRCSNVCLRSSNR